MIKLKKEHKISLAEEIDNHKKHEQEKKSIKVLEKKSRVSCGKSHKALKKLLGKGIAKM